MIQVWITAVGFPSEMRKIYPDSRIAGICSKLTLPVPPKTSFIIGMFLDIHQNLALVVCTLVDLDTVGGWLANFHFTGFVLVEIPIMWMFKTSWFRKFRFCNN